MCGEYSVLGDTAKAKLVARLLIFVEAAVSPHRSGLSGGTREPRKLNYRLVKYTTALARKIAVYGSRNLPPDRKHGDDRRDHASDEYAKSGYKIR